MASQQGGPSALASPHDAREATVTADSILDSPYSSDEELHPQDFSCRWRTSDFHDQECYRYFDCPSHLVERRLSVDDTGEPSLERERAAEATEIQADNVSPRTSIDQLAEPDQDDTATEPQRGEDTLVASPPRPLSGIASGLATEREGTSTARTRPVDPAALPVRTSSLPIRTRVPSRSIDLRPAGQSSSDIWGESSDHSSRGFSASASAADLSENSSPRMSARDQLSAMYAVDVDRMASESALHHSLIRSSERERERAESAVVLPRWQPDGEVTYCPICRTQFSIFVRKHHCRKCGRVVCNSCSPHRIIIPHQFIVRAPGSEVPPPPALFFDSSGAGYVDMNGPSGGERVRLCNPCVPDPNTAPPQNPGSPGLSPRSARRRSRTSMGGGYATSNPVNNRYGGVFAAGQSNDPYQFYTSRTRSITMDPTGQRAGGASSSSASSRRRSSANYEVSSLNRLLAAGPSPFTMPNQHHIHRRRLTGESGSSSRQRALPPPPQIAEEDECPICHLELPSRELPSFEALRESHITTCIQSHSTYGSPRGLADSATPPPPPRRTGMYTYAATEKDCIDDAECTICLEEFTVGIPMARLECLCRFHRSCISAWFVNHPGRCPVHQHDGFGY